MNIDGKRLFRVIAESIIRGGVKAIPFVGSGIDQATFGIKDAISNAEAKELLRRIVDQVNEIRPVERELSDRDIAAIVEGLLEKPEVVEIINQIQKVNLSALRELSGVMASVQRLSTNAEAITFEVKAIRENVVLGNESILRQIRESSLFNATAYTHIQDSLSYLSSLLVQFDNGDQRSLQEIYGALKVLDARLLDLSAHSFRVALESLSSGRELSATMDFSELHRYLFSPYMQDPMAPLCVYLIHNSPSPLFLLPASLVEMQHYLSHELITFFDRKRLADRLSLLLTSPKGPERPLGDIDGRSLQLLANLTMHNNSPLQRMKRLLENGLIRCWDKPCPNEGSLRRYTETVFSLLSRFRRRRPSRVANLIDAENLSLLELLNSSADSGQQRFVHVSGAKAMKEAAANLFAADDIPLVVHPLTWSYRAYVTRLGGQFEHGHLLSISETLEETGSFVRCWVDRLSKQPIWDEIERLSETLERVHGSLVAFRQVVEPFHRLVLETEIADLSLKMKPFGTTLWEQDFDRAVDETLGVIFGLLSYVGPLDRRMKPFSALADEIGQVDKKSREAEPLLRDIE